jgi:glycosyltransferase involved in cell wall biosynthesis
VRIAVNTRLLLEGRLEGLGRFAFETLRMITRSHPEHEFIFLFDRPFSPTFVFSENVVPVVIGPPSRHPLLWYLWFEHSVPNVLKRYQPNIFLSPDGFLSLNSKVKSVPVIHDLNFVHNPHDLAWSHSAFYNHYFPKYAQKAARIATVSEFSKEDISTTYGIPSDRIDVVYNGVSERFHPISEAEKVTVRQKWTHGFPYFVFVGAIHPRKNIANMLLAYDRFRQQVNTEHRMLVVGNRKWWTNDMQQALDAMQFGHEVIFTGRVEEELMNGLVAAALAQVYVSTFEGFGIPIVEAFQAQVPVITSNVTSMPEVAGDAALLVNPLNVDDIAASMTRIYDSSDLRNLLVNKGLNRTSTFTWERSAQLLYNCMMNA